MMNTHWLAYCSIIPNHSTYHLTQWKTVSKAWNIYLLFATQINISDDFPANDDEIWTEPVKHFSKWLSNFSTEARNAAVTKIGYRFFSFSIFFSLTLVTCIENSLAFAVCVQKSFAACIKNVVEQNQRVMLVIPFTCLVTLFDE